jgi:hypothetical protein
MVAHPGPNSPNDCSRKLFDGHFSTRAAMRQPVTPAAALEAINLDIQGSVAEVEVREWKKKVLK